MNTVTPLEMIPECLGHTHYDFLITSQKLKGSSNWSETTKPIPGHVRVSSERCLDVENQKVIYRMCYLMAFKAWVLQRATGTIGWANIKSCFFSLVRTFPHTSKPFFSLLHKHTWTLSSGRGSGPLLSHLHLTKFFLLYLPHCSVIGFLGQVRPDTISSITPRNITFPQTNHEMLTMYTRDPPPHISPFCDWLSWVSQTWFCNSNHTWNYYISPD